MTDPTDKQLEWAGRLLCVVNDLNPDGRTAIDGVPEWKHPATLAEARRLLAELERQGVKATTRPDVIDRRPFMADDVWDASPICPDAE